MWLPPPLMSDLNLPCLSIYPAVAVLCEKTIPFLFLAACLKAAAVSHLAAARGSMKTHWDGCAPVQQMCHLWAHSLQTSIFVSKQRVQNNGAVMKISPVQ